MTKKELCRLYKSQNLLKSYQRQIEALEALEDLIMSPKAIAYGERVQTSRKTSSVLESKVVMILNLRDLISQEMKEILELTLKAKKDFKILDNIERAVMELRYLEGLSWDRISIELNYSEQHLFRLHSDALGKMRASESL